LPGYKHPESHLGKDVPGRLIRHCPKCHRLARFHTICNVCLDKVRDMHYRYYGIWDVEPEDVGKFNRGEILRLFVSGRTIESLMQEFGLKRATVKWIIKSAVNSGEINTQKRTRRIIKIIEDI
jgi:recombinational DNA repair protein RecR